MAFRKLADRLSGRPSLLELERKFLNRLGIEHGFSQSLCGLIRGCSSNAQAGARTGECDVAIVSDSPKDKHSLAIPLVIDEFLALCPASHPLARQPHVTGQELAIHELVLLGRGSAIGTRSIMRSNPWRFAFRSSTKLPRSTRYSVLWKLD
ncbi:MAG: hypothetical protein EBT08_01865, partial [Betaproteobacteria bacterium]|nr:hypothetical protein [Betaproteobacteria bacterium]